MNIANDSVATFHYTLTNTQGEVLDQSKDDQPLEVLIGKGNIIPGLEKAMHDHKAGDEFGVDVAAADAYGTYQPQMVQRVSKKHFGKGARLLVGMPIQVPTKDGARMAWVKKVGMSVVDLDFNHPLADQDLHFEVRVTDVRPATEDELAAGRPLRADEAASSTSTEDDSSE